MKTKDKEELIDEIIDCIYFAKEYYSKLPFTEEEIDNMICYLQELKSE